MSVTGNLLSKIIIYKFSYGFSNMEKIQLSIRWTFISTIKKPKASNKHCMEVFCMFISHFLVKGEIVKNISGVNILYTHT